MIIQQPVYKQYKYNPPITTLVSPSSRILLSSTLFCHMGTTQTPPTTQLIPLSSLSSLPSSPNIYQSRLSSSSSFSSKQLLHRTLSFTQSSQSVTRFLSLLQKIGRKIQCSNLYMPVLCHVRPSEGNCNDYQILNLYYEDYGTRLKDQIQARRRYRDRFAQEEIWYIVYSIVKAVRMFEKIGISSGNLKTQKILLNEKGHLKVVNTLSYPEEMDDNVLENGNDNGNNGVKRFFAPEELRAMRERIDKKINPNIAQTFAIGIIVLQLATFVDGNNFYDSQRLTLNDFQLKRADSIISQNYSKLLYNLTRTLLSGQYDRPLPSQIYSVFYPYESKILALKPFNFQPLGNMNNSNSMRVSNASLMSL